MGLIFAEAFGRDIKNFESNKDVYFACGLTELIHNGSLMIDDVQDSSQSRRGDKCTHLKYGLDVAVNAGNILYYAPLLKLDKYVPKMG